MTIDLKKIKPPTASPSPDPYTKRCFVSGDGEGQVFHFDKFGMRYGTDDKGHAASLILSALLLIVTMFILIIGAIVSYSGADSKWVEMVISWVGNAFLFTAGIAIGKSSKSKNKSN